MRGALKSSRLPFRNVSPPRFTLRPQVLALALGATLALGLLAIPRPTRTRIVPLPRVDFQELKRRDAEDARLREKADFPVHIRRAGERFRRLGAALWAERAGAPPLAFPYRIESSRVASLELVSEFNALRAEGQSADLIRLRSLQSELFVRAVRRYEETQELSRELIELGGDFIDIARGSWMKDGRVTFSDQDLRLLFRVRFGKLTDTHGQGQFGPSPDELLYYHALFLLHPPGADAHSRNSYKLNIVAALERLEPSYPAGLTRALLLLEQNQPEAAAQALSSAKQTGPWTRIVQNTLLAASALHHEL